MRLIVLLQTIPPSVTLDANILEILGQFFHDIAFDSPTGDWVTLRANLNNK